MGWCVVGPHPVWIMRPVWFAIMDCGSKSENHLDSQTPCAGMCGKYVTHSTNETKWQVQSQNFNFQCSRVCIY